MTTPEDRDARSDLHGTAMEGSEIIDEAIAEIERELAVMVEQARCYMVEIDGSPRSWVTEFLDEIDAPRSERVRVVRTLALAVWRAAHEASVERHEPEPHDGARFRPRDWT